MCRGNRCSGRPIGADTRAALCIDDRGNPTYMIAGAWHPGGVGLKDCCWHICRWCGVGFVFVCWWIPINKEKQQLHFLYIICTYIYMYTFQHRPRPQISCVFDLRESWNTVSKARCRRFSFIVPAFEDMEAAGPAMIPRGVINFQRPFGRPRSWLCLLCREFFFGLHRA